MDCGGGGFWWRAAAALEGSFCAAPATSSGGLATSRGETGIDCDTDMGSCCGLAPCLAVRWQACVMQMCRCSWAELPVHVGVLEMRR